MAEKRVNLGNISFTGFVNHLADGRIVVGTGSYTAKNGTKVYKESVTAFLDQQYDGYLPRKGEYVRVSADISVSPNIKKLTEKFGADVANALVAEFTDFVNTTTNLRFGNQLTKLEAPQKAQGGDGGQGGDQSQGDTDGF